MGETREVKKLDLEQECRGYDQPNTYKLSSQRLHRVPDTHEVAVPARDKCAVGAPTLRQVLYSTDLTLIVDPPPSSSVIVEELDEDVDALKAREREIA